MPPLDDDADRWLRLACLTYEGDDRRRFDEARALLASQPALGRASVFTLAATADVEGLREVLAREPSLAHTAGGPFGWEPLLYVTYARLGIGAPVEAARVLLAAGADPNAGWLCQGLVPPFTALTGAFGEGEDTANQPRHPDAPALARLLLEAGADPNDGQALYNRQFGPDDDHLVLLLGFGLGRGDGGPWKRRLGSAQATPAQLLEDQLLVAAADDRPARVALLLRHGVDPNGQGTRHPIHQGRGALELARANGCAAVKALLLGAGATGPAEDAVDALVSAAMRGDERVADASPELVAAAVARRPGQVRVAAERGRHGAVRLLAALGFDPNHLYGTTALHEAALRGDHALVDLLLALGADPSIRDVRFHATPAGWADHQGHAALAAELRAREQTG